MSQSESWRSENFEEQIFFQVNNEIWGSEGFVFPTKACSQEELAPLLGTDPDGGGWELDHNEPPDGEAEGQPDGDSVDHYAEVDMEQQEHRPAKRELMYRKMEFDCSYSEVLHNAGW